MLELSNFPIRENQIAERGERIVHLQTNIPILGLIIKSSPYCKIGEQFF